MTEPMKISKRYTYDAENQLTSVTYEDGAVISYTYDKAGNRISVTRSGGAGPGVPIMSSVQAEPPSQKTPLTPAPAAQQICGNCGTPIKPGKKFCSNCGAPVTAPAPAVPASPPSVCPACGSPVRPGATFCAKCGRKTT
jgi:YD repeat-containing protein